MGEQDYLRCPGGGASGSWAVDGADAFVRECSGNGGTLIVTETRGYVIWQAARPDEPGLVEKSVWDWLKAVLETVDLRPDEALDLAPTTPGPASQPPPRPSVPAQAEDPRCIGFQGEGTYLANIGSLLVSMTVPATPETPWRGDRDGFALRKANCGLDGIGLPLIHAEVVDRVYADACHWQLEVAETPTASDVLAELKVQAGHDTAGPVETTLGRYAATRFEFSFPRDLDIDDCDRDGLPWVKLWGDEILVQGGSKQVYVADVDGEALVVTVGYYPGEITTAGLAEIDAILASLRVATNAS